MFYQVLAVRQCGVFQWSTQEYSFSLLDTPLVCGAVVSSAEYGAQGGAFGGWGNHQFSAGQLHGPGLEDGWGLVASRWAQWCLFFFF